MPTSASAVYVCSSELLIELLEEYRQAIIHHAVTRGLDPDVRLKPFERESGWAMCQRIRTGEDTKKTLDNQYRMVRDPERKSNS